VVPSPLRGELATGPSSVYVPPVSASSQPEPRSCERNLPPDAAASGVTVTVRCGTIAAVELVG